MFCVMAVLRTVVVVRQYVAWAAIKKEKLGVGCKEQRRLTPRAQCIAMDAVLAVI